MGIRGYKVFNPDWTCQGFHYEVGKTYKHDGNIEMCRAGFHFCQKISDCFNYYDFDINNKVAEVEAIGNVETLRDKSVTDEIVILRELTWYEVCDLVNTGKRCMGYNNKGDYNKGNFNRGSYNIGNHNIGNANRGGHNTGYYNKGFCNSGNHNIGNCNSGDCNSGDCNKGDYNRGNCNRGDWNSTSYATGFFNSIKQPLYIFNKPSDMSIDDFNNLIAVRAMRNNYVNNVWIYSEYMTKEEKEAHPEHETTGGYLKTVDFKKACSLMWDKMTAKEKASVKDIPNFDATIFEEITGIVVD